MYSYNAVHILYFILKFNIFNTAKEILKNHYSRAIIIQ